MQQSCKLPQGSHRADSFGDGMFVSAVGLGSALRSQMSYTIAVSNLATP